MKIPESGLMPANKIGTRHFHSENNGDSREISYRSAKTRCKILSSARGCSLLAVCVNLSCLFKNKLSLIFFRGLVGVFFFSQILKLHFRGNPQNRGKMGALFTKHCNSIMQKS